MHCVIGIDILPRIIYKGWRRLIFGLGFCVVRRIVATQMFCALFHGGSRYRYIPASHAHCCLLSIW
ncbi:hypothetical protein BDV06DRAFT_203156 [Aspergillus oleicola]